MTYLRTTTVIYTTSGLLHKYVERTENSTYFINHVDMTTETINEDKENVVVVNNVRTKSTILTTITKNFCGNKFKSAEERFVLFYF